MAFKNNYFDTALADEGILGTPLELLARATFGQESGSGRNPSTSYAGARGPMQVLPDTFRSVADPSWSIDDPVANTRAGIRYLKQGWQASGGNPNLTAAYYYGGPGGMNKLANGIAVGDPRNPNAPNTAQYANQVVNRMGTSNNGNNMANPALYQADPNQQPEYTPNPILKQDPNAGIFSKIANSPGMSDALIQMGAGLLSSTGDQNPLASGLSKGFTGFNTGYSEGIANSKAKAIPIAGGAFTQITDAKGNVTVVPNAQAQDFLLKSLGVKGLNIQAAQDNKVKNAPLTAKEQEDKDNRETALAGFANTQNEIKDLDSFATKIKPGFIEGVANALPGTTALASHFSDTAANASAYNQKISSVLTTKWLDLGQKLKGAQSDKEGAALASTLPDPKADYQTVIKPWLEKYNVWLEKNKALLEQQNNPNNRYPEGSKFRTDNTGLTAPPPGAVQSSDIPDIKSLSPGETVVPQNAPKTGSPKTRVLKNGTIVTEEN